MFLMYNGPMRRFLMLAAALIIGLTCSLARPVSAQSYGPDLTSTSTAISGGDNGAHAATYAFDNDTTVTNYWESSQTTNSVSGAAYIGQDFGSGVAYHVRLITVKQHSAAGQAITDARLESGNCSTWNTVTSITLAISSAVQQFAIPSSAAARCWRLLALSNPTSTSWRVYEMEMMELVSWPTDTPGPSSTPTITLTPSTTPSPTPNYFVEVTSTLGSPMRLERSASMGEIGVTMSVCLVGAIVGLAFLVYFWRRIS